MAEPSATTRQRRALNLPNGAIWPMFAVVLMAAPYLVGEGAGLSLLSQIGMVMIFGLSYNMLLGQGGMLSFGHAIYSGLSAYCVAHAMNLAGAGTLAVPISLMPFLGCIAGIGFGMLFGYVTTRRAGTAFAMITLGLMELVSASTLLFPVFFGGEGGLSTNRVIGPPVLGIHYRSALQVYFLIAFWLFVSTAAMYAFTRTPLGRILNAVRDNPERAQCIGYDPQRVRYLTLILSAGFAGISGALSVIYFESVSPENVGAARSGAILLFTVIGGIGFFVGPMIGAVAGVLLTIVMSDLTRAWHLYLGVFFMLIVRFAPGGIAGLVAIRLPTGLGKNLMQNLMAFKNNNFRRAFVRSMAMLVAGSLILTAAVLMTEMLYRLSLESDDGSTVQILGMSLIATDSMSWGLALSLFLGGILLMFVAHRCMPTLHNHLEQKT